jgi:uncharacterized NAD(P)/FAD-binding protein YdhS
MKAHLAIVGGGATGTLLAIHALRLGRTGERIVLIDSGPRPGGIAYRTDDPLHLLNVPASRMSAFASEPGHFVDWLRRRAPSVASDFVPRGLHGRYLAEALSLEAEKSAATLEQIKDEVISVEPPGPGRSARVLLREDRSSLEARTVVLATDHHFSGRPPEALSQLEPGTEYFGRIWGERGLIELPSRDARVLLLGTGLTMADVALTLVSRGHRGKLIALSSRGLLPPPFRQVSAPTQLSWRPRLPPDTASRLHEVVAWRKLELKAGRILGAWRLMKSGKTRAIRVEYFSKELGTPAKLETDVVLNCMGPEADLAKSAPPLLETLLSRGLVRLDRRRSGLETDSWGRLIDHSGAALDWARNLGPLSRGKFWESTAIPELRVQAERMAGLLG